MGHQPGQDAEEPRSGRDDVDVATRGTEELIGPAAADRRQLHEHRQADRRQPAAATSQGCGYHLASHTRYPEVPFPGHIVADTAAPHHHQGVPSPPAIGLGDPAGAGSGRSAPIRGRGEGRGGCSAWPRFSRRANWAWRVLMGWGQRGEETGRSGRPERTGSVRRGMVRRSREARRLPVTSAVARRRPCGEE